LLIDGCKFAQSPQRFQSFHFSPSSAETKSWGYENEAAFLVRRAADYSQALLEPIEGDWNTQTLARSEMWTHEANLYEMSIRGFRAGRHMIRERRYFVGAV